MEHFLLVIGTGDFMNIKEDEVDPNKEMQSSFIDRLEKGNGEQNTYRVIIDGINAEVETKDSFAIKLSLFAKLPVTKVKHMVKTLPSVALRFSDELRAKKLVSLIEEAGGYAHIEADKKKAVPKKAKSKERFCRKCGFPLKDGEKYCSFCLTPVDEAEEEHVKAAEKALQKKKRVRSIPPKRLYVYFAIMIFILIVKLLIG
ncbi:MAG: hypothetical protein B6D63_02680 [Candidatus Latescibacteria bacterium 4484_7]|nr:MAG: hypothetical protein B6D63_02680 [Candidatus Latescibacteria bacterium 4484_7]